MEPQGRFPRVLNGVPEDLPTDSMSAQGTSQEVPFTMIPGGFPTDSYSNLSTGPGLVRVTRSCAHAQRQALMHMPSAVRPALLRMLGVGVAANGGPYVVSYRLVCLCLPTISRGYFH